MLLNCEDRLADLAEWVSIYDFPLASSTRECPDDLDLALVEGSVSTPHELIRLLELRRRVKLLVAVGSCALNGGVNALAGEDRGSALVRVYETLPRGLYSFPPRPLHDFVTVDWRIPGCPPERHDLIETLGALLLGGCPGWQEMPVCMECRIAENRCLLTEDRAPCFGPVTRAGCRARCPGRGVPCEGCRGSVDEANQDELFRQLLETGMSEREIERRMARFGGIKA